MKCTVIISEDWEKAEKCLVTTNTTLHILYLFIYIPLSLHLYTCVCVTKMNYILHNSSEEVPQESLSPL